MNKIITVKESIRDNAVLCYGEEHCVFLLMCNTISFSSFFSVSISLNWRPEHALFTSQTATIASQV